MGSSACQVPSPVSPFSKPNARQEIKREFRLVPAGGYGTLEEGLEMITWQQLGYHRKPVGVLNACGFYDKLLEHFDRSVAEVGKADRGKGRGGRCRTSAGVKGSRWGGGGKEVEEAVSEGTHREGQSRGRWGQETEMQRHKDSRGRALDVSVLRGKGFVGPAYRDVVISSSDPGDLINQMLDYDRKPEPLNSSLPPLPIPPRFLRSSPPTLPPPSFLVCRLFCAPCRLLGVVLTPSIAHSSHGAHRGCKLREIQACRGRPLGDPRRGVGTMRGAAEALEAVKSLCAKSERGFMLVGNLEYMSPPCCHRLRCH